VVIVSTAGAERIVKLSVCWMVCEGAELSRSVNVWVVVAAVVGVPHRELGEEVKAVVQLKPGSISLPSAITVSRQSRGEIDSISPGLFAATPRRHSAPRTGGSGIRNSPRRT